MDRERILAKRWGRLVLLIIFFSCLFFIRIELVPQAESDRLSAEFAACRQDSDCVPAPGCDPISCVNVNRLGDLRDKLKNPNPSGVVLYDDCRPVDSNVAANSPEDCLCLRGRCVNRNNSVPLSKYLMLLIRRSLDLAN